MNEAALLYNSFYGLLGFTFILLIAVLKRTLFSTKLDTLKKFSYFLVLICYLLCFELPYPEKVYRFLYYEDGLLESMTALFALLSALVILATFKINRSEHAVSFRVVLFLAFSFFFLEEISWGQRVFSMSSPEFFYRLNDQKEINLHNFFNSYLHGINVIFNLLIGLFLLLIPNIESRLVHHFRLQQYLNVLPTHQNQIFGLIFLILSVHCIVLGGEVTEQVFSIFILGYSIEVFLNIREHKIQILNEAS